LIAHFFRSQILPCIYPGSLKEPLSLESQLRSGFLYGILIIIFVFAFEKLYTKRFSFWEEVKQLLKGVTLSFILLMMIVFISRGYTQFSRAVIVFAWLLSLFIFAFFSFIVKKLIVIINLWKKKIIILGTSNLAKSIIKGINNNSTLGYKIIGFLADSRRSVGEIIMDEIRIIGNIKDVEQVSKKYGVNDIIIALPNISQRRLIELMESCEKVAETIRIVPSMGSLFTTGVEIESMGDILSLSVPRNLMKPWNIFLKRSFERTLTLILVIILFPILLIIGLAIRIDSAGSVIFTHKRLGRKNIIFDFYKFRSMYLEGDLKLNKYLKENPQIQIEWKKYQKIKGNDPRVTRVGRFIRKYSLDELPQLLNVLKGDMNLVGPRPYMPREKEKISKSYQIIARVRPGITGLWQVSGRNLLSFKERLLLDEYYIRNWSLWLDIVILLKTIKVFCTREGAY